MRGRGGGGGGGGGGREGERGVTKWVQYLVSKVSKAVDGIVAIWRILTRSTRVSEVYPRQEAVPIPVWLNKKLFTTSDGRTSVALFVHFPFLQAISSLIWPLSLSSPLSFRRSVLWSGHSLCLLLFPSGDQFSDLATLFVLLPYLQAIISPMLWSGHSLCPLALPSGDHFSYALIWPLSLSSCLSFRWSVLWSGHSLCPLAFPSGDQLSDALIWPLSLSSCLSFRWSVLWSGHSLCPLAFPSGDQFSDLATLFVLLPFLQVISSLIWPLSLSSCLSFGRSVVWCSDLATLFVLLPFLRAISSLMLWSGHSLCPLAFPSGDQFPDALIWPLSLSSCLSFGRSVPWCSDLATLFVLLPFLQAISSLMLWFGHSLCPLAFPSGDQFSDAVIWPCTGCSASLSTPHPCSSFKPVAISALFASPSACSFPRTPARPGLQIHSCLCSWSACITTCESGQP